MNLVDTLPFWVGWLPAQLWAVHGLYVIFWEFRETYVEDDELVQSDWKQFKHRVGEAYPNVRWLHIVGIPFLVGVVTFVVWWGIYLTMGVLS